MSDTGSALLDALADGDWWDPEDLADAVVCEVRHVRVLLDRAVRMRRVERRLVHHDDNGRAWRSWVYRRRDALARSS